MNFEKMRKCYDVDIESSKFSCNKYKNKILRFDNLKKKKIRYINFDHDQVFVQIKNNIKIMFFNYE